MSAILSQRVLAHCALLAGLGSPAQAQRKAVSTPAVPTSLQALFRDTIGFSGSQLRLIERGDAVAREAATNLRRDVAFYGVVQIGVPRAFFVQRFKDFNQSLRGPRRAGFRLFDTPAVPANVDSITLSPEDAARLRSCVPGDCKFKLPSTEMGRLRTMLERGDERGRVQASNYLRARIAEYVNAYRARGGEGMIVYEDGDAAMRASTAFEELVADWPASRDVSRPLLRYLVGYPAARPDGMTDAIFWAFDKNPGVRPMVIIDHVAVVSPPERPDVTTIAIKQLFANHYLEAALDIYLAIDPPAGGDRGRFYLILMRQARFDALPSFGPFSLRGRVVAKMKELTESDLQRMKVEYEGAFLRSP